MTTILALSPGLHSNVSPEVYHARVPGLVSKSALDLVHRSPLHYKAWLDGAEEEPTPALQFGAAFHCALLEPDRFATAYAAEPEFGDCRKTANKAARDEWRALHAGALLISVEDEIAIRAMVSSVHEHPLAGKMIRDGEPELTVRWNDAETGLPCKSRADYYVRKLGMIVDVKGMLDGTAETFRRSIANYRYHVQDALYRDGFAAVGAPMQHFVFVVVEKTNPHAVSIFSLDEDGVQRGYAAARRDIDRLAECMRSTSFPGYPTEIQTINLPPWAA